MFLFPVSVSESTTSEGTTGTHHLSLQNIHLFVHEDVDDGVNDSAALGKDRRNDAGNGANDSWLAEGGHHGNDTIRHPAEQITHHCGNDHEQDVKLSATSRRSPDTTHLGNKTQVRNS